MPRCNYCNTQLQVHESYDIQFEDNQYRDIVYGYCPKCGVKYRWDEIYIYQSFEHLEERKL